MDQREPYGELVPAPGWAQRFRELVQIIGACLGFMLWILLGCLLIWTARYWEIGTLEAMLVVFACFTLLCDLMLWIGLATSSSRHLIGRKGLMLAISLVGFLVGVFPAVCLPIIAASSACRDPRMQEVLMALAFAGMILVGFPFFVGDTRTIAQRWEDYRAMRTRP